MLSIENNRTIQAVLEQLNRHGVHLANEVVRPLLDEVLNSPGNGMFGDVLRALAPSDPDTAMRLADEYLDGRVLRWRDPAAEFIREDGHGITDVARKYLEPLIRGEAPPVYGRNGLPKYVQPTLTIISPRLAPYEA